MEQQFKCVLTAGLAIALAGQAHAAQTSAGASATVVAPIAIAKTGDLAFGAFTTGAAGETVTINPAGVRSAVGALVMPGPVSAATFNVTGSGNLSYSITLPASIAVTTGAATASETMLVTGFSSNPSGTGTLTAGAQALAVGATITTVAAQAPGLYTGTFHVSVDYN